MPSPSAIFPIMEGLVGTQATGTAGGQEIGAWVRMTKVLLTEIESLRSSTTFVFALADDIDETATVVDTTAVSFLSTLIGYDAATAGGDLVCFTDASTNTFSGAAALDATDFLVFTVPAATTEDTEEYHGLVYIKAFTIGDLVIGMDAQGGTDPAADDGRAWVLYQT